MAASTCRAGAARWRVAGARRSAVLAGIAAAAALLAVMAGGPASAAIAGDVRDGGDDVPQGGIRGLVIDAESREPLPGAVVRILELGREELTHSDGTFQLPRIPPGEYTLIFQRLGYARESRRVAVARDEIVHMEVGLRVSALELPGVVVTGTPGARLGDDAFRPISVLSGQGLARKLDGTIGATLDREPGIAVVSMGPATSRPVIRGLGGDRILILEDGARIGDMSASSPDHAVAIEPLSARRIEVVRGPAALLYGSNALGGVVNVIRDEVPSALMNGPHGSVSLQGQSVSRGGAAEGSIAGSAGHVALRAEASGRWAGDTRTPLGSLENTSLGTYNAAVGAGVVGNSGHLGAAFRAYISSYGVPPDTVTGHPHGVTVEMDRFTGRLKGELRPGGGIFSNVRADASLTHYYHRELEAPRSEVRAGEPFLIGTEFELLTGALDVLAQHGRLGPFSDGAVGFRAQWRDFATGGSLATPPATEVALAGFLFQEVDRRPLRLHLGARYDWTRIAPGVGRQPPTIGDVRTRSFGSVSGSVGFLYELAQGVSIGTSVSRAFRTPDMNELFSEGPHLANYSFEIGNPDLKDETGLGVDVFGRINRHDLRLELAVFHNRVHDYVFPRETGDSVGGLPVLRFTNDDATLQGVEASIELSLARYLVLHGTASYTHGSRPGGDPLPLIPPLRGAAGLRWEGSALSLGLGLHAAAAQNRLGEFEEPTASYTLLNADAGYRRTALGRVHTITLGVENVTDVEYREHLSRLRQPQPGRNFRLLYRVAF